MICNVCGRDKKHHAHGMCRRCYNAKYRDEHREEISQHKKEYYAAHREEISQSTKEYRAANRDKCRERTRGCYYKHGGKPASENKQCPVFLGVHVAEQVLSKVFKNVEQMPYGHKGCDFICNKGKKIDVKSACTRVRDKCSDNWAFMIRKNKIADFFLCLAFDNREDLNPLHIWLIPGNIINHLMGASISESTISKWDEYKLDIAKVTTCCDSMKHSNWLA